jgi:LysR family cyn operon transcriptional activator
MELRHLEYFLSICQELHFTRAAEKLNISQPTLSQQIRVLEDEIGTPLFERISKKVLITEAGQILYQHCLQVFDELRQSSLAIQELKGLQQGTLKVGCCGNHLFISSIIAFHKSYPGIKISVAELSNEEIRQMLIQNELDLGIVCLPLEDQNIESIFLYTEELCLVVSTMNHAFANHHVVDLEMLKSMPIVLMPKKYIIRQMIDQACKSVGFLFDPVIEMMAIDSLIEVVGQKLAVTIIPKSYLENIHDSRVRTLSIINPILKKEVGIVYRKDRFMSAATKAFIQQLKIVIQTSTD